MTGRESFEFQAECYKWWQLLPKDKLTGWLEKSTYFELWERVFHVSVPGEDYSTEVKLLEQFHSPLF